MGIHTYPHIVYKLLSSKNDNNVIDVEFKFGSYHSLAKILWKTLWKRSCKVHTVEYTHYAKRTMYQINLNILRRSNHYYELIKSKELSTFERRKDHSNLSDDSHERNLILRNLK